MANAKKSTLDTPETRNDVTYIKLMTAEINFETGKVEGIYCKCDSAGDSVGSGRYSFDMPATNLATLENEIITEADTAAALPAGTVGDI